MLRRKTYGATPRPVGSVDLMTLSRSLAAPTSRSWARTMSVAVLALACAAKLAACSPGAGPGDPGSAPSAPVDGSSGDEQTTDEPDGVGYTPEDVGNGTLTVNGVTFPDFVGDCEINRNNGREDVGDLNEGDINTIIGIDNVEAHLESSMSYVAISEESFTFRDPQSAAGVGLGRHKGVINTMTELSPRTASGSRDIVEVRFAGVLEDGTTVDADVVCELQNTFS